MPFIAMIFVMLMFGGCNVVATYIKVNGECKRSGGVLVTREWVSTCEYKN